VFQVASWNPLCGLFAAAILALIPAHFQQSIPATPTETASIQGCNTQQGNRASEIGLPDPFVRSQASLALQERHGQSEQETSYNAREDTLYRLYLGFTILGVIGAWIGLRFLFRQSAQLQSQIRLQSVALRQWVDTRNWRASTPYPTRPQTLEIDVDIVNPTKAPIVLLLVRITVSGGKISAIGFPPNTLLIPNTPLTYQAFVDVSREQREHYRSEAGLVLQVEGFISYVDSLKDAWGQRFQLMLRCDHGFAKAAATGYTYTLHEGIPIVGKPRRLWRLALDWYLAQIEAMKNGESGND
jgi:hypothetical protein